MDNMRCASCGGETAAGQRFCPNCGDAVATAPPPTGGQAATPGKAPARRGVLDATLGFLPRALRVPTAVVAVLLVGLLVLGAASSGGGRGAGGGEPITSESRAQFMVTQVVRAAYHGVVDDLSEGEHADTIVQGASGRALVTGHVRHDDEISCGSDCVRAQTDVEVTIVFEDFTTSQGEDSETALDGTITYSDDTWSRQVRFDAYSGGDVTVSGSGLWMQHTGSDAAGSWRYVDTIDFQGSTASPLAGTVHGSCTPSEGRTYRF